MKRQVVVVFLILLIAVSSAIVGRLLACGYRTPALIMVNAVWPADAGAFAKGRIGVVQPTYAREYLAKAYRRFTGVARGVDPERAPVDSGRRDRVLADWLRERGRILGTAGSVEVGMFKTWRQTDHLAYYLNCTEDALATAVVVLNARAAELGPASGEVRDWLHAQDQVFANCGDAKAPIVPPALPATAPAGRRADRAYQIAAAFFYAGHFGEAEARFRAIAGDVRSPWRKYGRFLAARCLIRQATVVEREGERATQLMKRAERELQAVIADRALARVHDSARRLIAFVTARIDPIRRVHELSARFTSSAEVADQDYVDFVWLMDGFLSQNTSYPYDTIASRDELTANDDLVDWILAMQGTGEQAAAHAVERWQKTHTLPWLVAALWKVAPDAAEAPRLLEAAAQVPRQSPAHQTVAFLSIRLMTARNDRDRAREILRTLSTPDDRTPAEAANLFRAQALLLARSLDELLVNVGRMPVASGWSYGLRDERDIVKYDKPSIDFDGMIVLSERLPLARLVEALQSPAMPPRLRWRVAAMTFTRAVMLRDDAAGLASATVLRSAFPKLASEFDGYVNASDAEARHRAGILLIVRHPDIKAFVNAEDDDAYADANSGDFADNDRPSWWCGFGRDPTTGLSTVYGSPWVVTPLPELTTLSKSLPLPEFLDAADRRALESEFANLSSLGPAPNYLLREAIRWANERPSDPQAAEALSRAIRGTRWGCGDPETAAHARRAFRVLHTSFATSDWAKRTKHWYDPARR